MEHAVEERVPSGMAIYHLIVEAHHDNLRDRRAEQRYPLVRPVTIRGQVPCVAFSREISAGGIGLLHNVELSPGEVELVIPTKQGSSVRVRTRILWCQPCGEGWYISGGQFAGIASVVS